ASHAGATDRAGAFRGAGKWRTWRRAGIYRRPGNVRHDRRQRQSPDSALETARNAAGRLNWGHEEKGSMEEAISLFRYAIGPRFGRDYNRSRGAWFAGFAFYWFCIMLYRNCGPEITEWGHVYNWTGIVFSWSPNPEPRPGALIWIKSKKWGVYA